jgi:hypothetical protein
VKAGAKGAAETLQIDYIRAVQTAIGTNKGLVEINGAAPRHWRDKQFRSMLCGWRSMKRPERQGKKKLRAIAEKVVRSGHGGTKLGGCEQVANRLDGKPAQDINIESNVTHELASLSGPELAARIARELAALDGRGEAAKDHGAKLH